MEPQPRSGRTWMIVAAVFVGFWVAYLVFFAPRQEARQGAGSLEVSGQPVDYGWTLTDLDGRPVEFSRYKGRAVFLNVWATWCPPCVEEIPSIQRLARRPEVRDVAFVLVSIDEDLDEPRRFVKKHGLDVTVLHADDLPDVFRTEGIPATFLIEPDGTVAVSQVGSDDWDRPEMVATLKMMARKAGPSRG